MSGGGRQEGCVGKGVGRGTWAECGHELVGATAVVFLAREVIEPGKIVEHGGIGIGCRVVMGMTYADNQFGSWGGAKKNPPAYRPKAARWPRREFRVL